MVWNKLFKTDFTKDVFVLASSSFIAQGINFVFSIFLARIYLPEYFGTLSVFLTLAGFINVVASGKFDVALVAAKTETDAKMLFNLSFIVLAIISVLSFLFIGFIFIFDLPVYEHQEVRTWLFYLLFSIVFLTGTQVFWMYNVRQKNFKKISYLRIVETLVTGVGSLAFMHLFSKGLLFGTLAGQAITFILLAIIIFNNTPLASFLFTRKELLETFRKYSSFPKINIPQGFLDMFQIGVLTLLLSKYYGAEATGYYALCSRVLQLPMRLIIQPIAQVFFAEASEQFRNNHSLFPLVKRTVKKSFYILIAIPVILILFGPTLFSLIFSSAWNEAGEYARILSLWIFFDLIRSPISQVASILGKQKQVLVMGIISALSFVLVMISASVYSLPIHTTLWLVTATQSAMCIAVIIYILKISK